MPSARAQKIAPNQWLVEAVFSSSFRAARKWANCPISQQKIQGADYGTLFEFRTAAQAAITVTFDKSSRAGFQMCANHLAPLHAFIADTVIGLRRVREAVGHRVEDAIVSVNVDERAPFGAGFFFGDEHDVRSPWGGSYRARGVKAS
jgi:hypothetical protein